MSEPRSSWREELAVEALLRRKLVSVICGTPERKGARRRDAIGSCGREVAEVWALEIPGWAVYTPLKRSSGTRTLRASLETASRRRETAVRWLALEGELARGHRAESLVRSAIDAELDAMRRTPAARGLVYLRTRAPMGASGPLCCRCPQHRRLPDVDPAAVLAAMGRAEALNALVTVPAVRYALPE